jgi:rare lipoprotein A
MLMAAVLVASCALDTGRAPDSSWAVIDEASRLRSRPTSTITATPRRPLDVASWYGEWHHGRPTASGEPFDREALTAAHPSLPLGACVEVTHLASGRHVFVRVNDRGPYVPGRTIDLSQRAAAELGMLDDGVARVRIRKAKPEVCEE